jgi:hypothetical protein
MALVGAVLAFVVAPGFRFAIEDAKYVRSSANLHQIAIALQNYHNAFGCFPPAYQCDDNGKPIHSWRRTIPDFVEGREDAWPYDQSEPWNGPHNSKLGSEMPPYFCCPYVGRAPMTNYVAIVGKGTMWPGTSSTGTADVADGLSSTIMVVEITNSNIHWLEPRDIPIDELKECLNPRHRPSVGAQFKGGLVAYADGSVRYLPRDVTEKRLRALLSPAGNDTADAEE